jgi:S-adenosylmethionine hydrolase
LITLLTDFGVADTYVGQMKASILGVARSSSIVDLTHAVPPQDVFAGAFLLWTAVESFPPGTLHVAVVDPGVGSTRRPMAVLTRRGDILVGPDNGLLMPAAQRLGGIDAAVSLSERKFWRDQTSSTFHGRDIFAPVAGHLALGVRLSDLGPRVDGLVNLNLPEPNGLDGQVLHTDTYGNLVTNFAVHALPPRLTVRLGPHVIPRADHYAAAAPGELLALVGSAGLLEISVRDGSAAQLTGARRGTPVSLVAMR